MLLPVIFVSVSIISAIILRNCWRGKYCKRGDTNHFYYAVPGTCEPLIDSEYTQMHNLQSSHIPLNQTPLSVSEDNIQP